MATMVANGTAPNMPGPVGGGPATKRYRPAPAKTFQCRGYGDCRMVFSRSEHLARHIRKHTGERPFSCHCGKQFSRLDNLRQHAQTVHADKQEENEQMMRDLTTLHATMAAANKGAASRGGRRAVPPVTTLHLGGSPSSVSPNQGTLNLIKQEDMSSLPLHQRPGTSTGYEGTEQLYAWQNENTESRRHSFREPGQSFLAPGQSHSFRSYTDHARPRSSSSRPPTSSGATGRSLPPLAAVVSASLPSPPPVSAAQQQLQQQQQSQSVFSFPGSLALRRPSTASRPGTAPSSLFPKSSHYGLAAGRQQPDLSLLHSGFGPGRSASTPFGSEQQQHFQLGTATADPVPGSPPGHDSSPFYFHPPDSNASSSSSSTSPPSLNPRKRAFAGPDGPYDHASSSAAPLREHQPPGSSSGLLLGLNLGGLTGPGAAPDSYNYDYGSESRPQSRRLTVMELCNDNEQRPPSSSAREQFVPGSGAFLLSAAAAAAASGGYGYGSGYGGYAGAGYGSSTSRPTTSSGLVSSASALHLFDRTSSPPGQPSSPQQFAHHQQQQQLAVGGVSPTAGGTGNGAAATGSEGAQEFRGGGVYPTSFRVVQQQQQSAGDPYAPAVSPHPASSASHASTPTPPLSAGVLSPSTSSSSGHFASTQQRSFQQSSSSPYPPQYPSYPASFAQQQFAQHASSSSSQQFQQHQQFAQSPTFSDASVSSAGGHSPYSPRSPLSDTTTPPVVLRGGDGGFRHHHQQQQQFGGGGHGHGGGQHAGTQQLDGQVRVTVSPYATAAFGMIF
ncbi:hypothetical protein M413DRAFT_6754 [Hebeloma cylindrosporum]|uniref:C2H2-type domain-containing protein n=1 Tax=Hebeloma cylindrosporum TaxID=76867 RepID=A0A0C2YJJ8_HEBCY|nr:hypothetical protein M413DRAFT_6754 [Hebeloma cylindrosporum h7]